MVDSVINFILPILDKLGLGVIVASIVSGVLLQLAKKIQPMSYIKFLFMAFDFILMSMDKAIDNLKGKMPSLGSELQKEYLEELELRRLKGLPDLIEKVKKS